MRLRSWLLLAACSLAAALLTLRAASPQPGSPPDPRALLSNGGFEPTAQAGDPVAGWERHGGGYSVDRQVRRGGEQSIRCESRIAGAEAGARAALQLNQPR